MKAEAATPNVIHQGNQRWTKAEYDKLRQMWSEGLSTSEIGRRLERSKNSIVGASHRLDLPTRPSPIKRSYSTPMPKPTSATRPRTQDFPALALPTSIPDTIVIEEVVVPKIIAFPDPTPPKPAHASEWRCEFLSGAHKPYTRCENPARPGQSWCEEHRKVVFLPAVKMRDYA